MDILRFLNSRDVREHLKNINYQFSPLEAAWLVWQCESATLAEKYAAWNEIIETMPDCEVPERINCRSRVSLHDFLQEHMRVTDKYLQMFFENTEGTVYYGEMRSAQDREFYTPYYCKMPCSSYELCEKSLKKELDHEISMMKFQKKWIDSTKKITVEMTPGNEVMSCEVDFFDNKDEDILFSFEEMFFRIPIPFKKGDIICRYYCNNGVKIQLCSDIGVFEGSEHDECDRRDSTSGDNTDMCLNGIFQLENGSLFFDWNWTYLDYEYYRGELGGTRKILTAVSRYKKGRIALDTLMNAYYRIMTDENSKEMFDFQWEMDKALTEKND